METYNIITLIFSGMLALATSLLVFANFFLLRKNERMLKYQEILFKVNIIANVSKQVGFQKQHMPNHLKILLNAINKAIPEYKEEITEWYREYL